MWPFKKKKHELRVSETVQKEIIETYKSLFLFCSEQVKAKEKHIAIMLEMIKMYAMWDEFIIDAAKKQSSTFSLDEGPATTYLKSIGEYHEKEQRGKTYGH